MHRRHMHRRTRSLVLALVCVALTPLGSTTPVQAQKNQNLPPGIGIRLAEAPTDREDDPRAHLYIVDHLKPGATIVRRIDVGNGTDAPVTLQLYPAAATIEAGSFKVIEGRSENDLTKWITVDPPTLHLEVDELKPATVTVRVPADATDGERYAVALAELPPEGKPGSTVAIASRVGVRLYISVGAGGEPVSDFTIDTLRARREADGTPIVTAKVRNTGGRALDLSGELHLGDGPGGVSAGPFPVRVTTTLAIGAEGTVEVPLDKALPDGPWKASMTLRSGTLERTATGPLLFPQPGETGPEVDVDSAARGIGAAIALGVLLLLLAFFFFFFIVWRRKRDDDDEGEEEAEDAASR